MLRRAAIAVACLGPLGGCGSTSPHARKAAEIQAALGQLETNIKRVRNGKPLTGKGVERAFYHRGLASSGIESFMVVRPKGVSRPEWENAIRNDKTLPSGFRALLTGHAADKLGVAEPEIVHGAAETPRMRTSASGPK